MQAIVVTPEIGLPLPQLESPYLPTRSFPTSHVGKIGQVDCLHSLGTRECSSGASRREGLRHPDEEAA